MLRTFAEWLDGSLYGVLSWEKWDALRERVAGGGEAWYVYVVGHGLPETAMSGPALRAALDEIAAELRRLHRVDYFGVAYVDDLADPTFIKIFHPKSMGSGCGLGGGVLPGWTVTRMRPDAFACDLPVPQAPKPWWRTVATRLSGV